jgi:fucose permease
MNSNSDIHSVKTEIITIEDLGYSTKSIGVVFWFMVIIYMFINVDHGALPCATVALKEDLNIDNVQLGSLGSLVFFGIVIGSICAAFILSKMSYRSVLCLSFLGNWSGLMLFIVTKNFSIICFARFLSGFS